MIILVKEFTWKEKKKTERKSLSLVGLATRIMRTNTSQLSAPKRQDKPFIHIRALRKSQALVPKPHTKYLTGKAVFLI